MSEPDDTKPRLMRTRTSTNTYRRRNPGGSRWFLRCYNIYSNNSGPRQKNNDNIQNSGRSPRSRLFFGGFILSKKEQSGFRGTAEVLLIMKPPIRGQDNNQANPSSKSLLTGLVRHDSRIWLGGFLYNEFVLGVPGRQRSWRMSSEVMDGKSTLGELAFI